MSDGLRHDYAPIGLGKNWVTSVGGLPLMIRDVAHALIRSGHDESEAIEIAVGAVKRWAAGEPNGYKGTKHVTPETQAKAAAAVAQWEAIKAAAHAKSAAKGSGSRSAVDAINALISGTRDSGFGGAFVGEGTSSGDLIPRGIPAKQAKAATDWLSTPHAFRGKDLATCPKCGQAANAPIHTGSAKAQAIPPVPREANVRSEAVDQINALLGGVRADPVVTPAAVLPPRQRDGLTVHQRRQFKTAFLADADDLEPKFHEPVVALFEKQRAATVARLNGKRGRQMLSRATGKRAENPRRRPVAGPAAPITPIGQSDEAAATPIEVDTSAIFDPTFWADETAKTVQPIYDEAAVKAVAQVRSHLGETLTAHEAAEAETAPAPTLPTEAAGTEPVPTSATEAAAAAGQATVPAGTTPAMGEAAQIPIEGAHASVTAMRPTVTSAHRSPLDAVDTILRARAKRMADEVTEVTHKQIQDTLADGVQNGESIAQLGDRVKHVFDVATTSRAQTIARTESVGAMNESAAAYAMALPSSVVGRKQWAAHHDDRTRPSHKVADTQIRDRDVPYMVGPPTHPAIPMMFPHDPAAPADETINCRCTQFFLPPLKALTAAA